MQKISKLYQEYREIINYLVVGVLTTLINLIIYFICVHTFLDASNSLELQIANVLSWVGAVLFAYITNRIFVFQSKSKEYLKEIISFFGARLSTLLLDMLIMFIFVSLLRQSDTLAKLISQILVIIANYILSKIFVFKK